MILGMWCMVACAVVVGKRERKGQTGSTSLLLNLLRSNLHTAYSGRGSCNGKASGRLNRCAFKKTTVRVNRCRE